MTFVHHVRSQLAVAAQPPRGRALSGLLPQAFALLDWTMIVMLTAASGLAYDFAELGHISSTADRYVKLGVVAATLFFISAFARGIYARSQLDQLALQVKEIALSWAVVFTLFVIIAPVLGVADAPSRDIMLLSFVVGITGLSLARWGEQRALLSLLQPALAAKRQVVVIWQAKLNSANLTQTIEACGADLYKTVELPARWKESELAECMREVINYVRQHSIDEVLLAASWADTRLIERITEHLRVLPLPVTLLPDPVVSALLERPLVNLGPMRAVELQRAPLTIGQVGAKRMFDLTIAVGLLVLLTPALAVIAALIAIDSRGPIFFRQQRIGFNASIFRIYKFRTMTVLEDGAVIQAQRNDARVTRIGRFLRRSSIDELPQLLNVIKGDMSLVGPRPHALAHDNEYSQLIAFYAARHKVKPGITGWAQVNGLRGATPHVDTMMMRVEHDLWYINCWSLWLDIKIVLLTTLCICTGRNAH
jgi:Undecaprenyl-phosphate glucose phosphotransferase